MVHFGKRLAGRPANCCHLISLKQALHRTRNQAIGASFKLHNNKGVQDMGRSILLLFLGVPLPVVILLALFWH